jgi:ATP-dependent DNA helicase PIF1
MYYPRYKRKRTYPQYADFYRVKLMLNYIYRDADNLLEFGGNVFRTAIKAYDYCIQHHKHTATDGYSEAEAEEVQAEDD